MFAQRLRELRRENRLTQIQLAQKLHVSNGTVGMWETGKREPDFDTVTSLANLFHVSTDYLLGNVNNPFFALDDQRIVDEINSYEWPPDSKEKAPSLPDEAQKVAVRYSKLDVYGKAAVQAVMGEEEARIREQAELDLIVTKPDPKIIPLYWSPAAAGIAAPILGEEYDHYELKPEDPQGAMFAIKVSGDSMEPHFPDGSIVFCNKDPIADGDIGVFCLDGESFIKQYHHDRFMGMTYLLSLNRDRADADKLITRSSGQTLTCMGRVITRRRYPLPR